MIYTESSKRATMKYQKEKLEQIIVRVPKGKREQYHSIAEQHGKTLTRYIIDFLETGIDINQELTEQELKELETILKEKRNTTIKDWLKESITKFIEKNR